MMQQSRGRARIGVLVPFTNTNLEADMMLLRPAGVSFHFARIGGYDADAVPDSGQMSSLGAAPLDEPLQLLSGVRPDLVMYGCTSATLTHGVEFDRDLASRIAVSSGAKTVTAAGSLIEAVGTLGVSRIGFASPYVAQINDEAIAFLGGCGIETVSRFDYPVALGNYGQGELDPDQVFELGIKADSPGAQAIVLSCTDMRALEVIDRLEKTLGKPVISSNQAMLFVALELLGLDTKITGYGTLLARRISGRKSA
ncbi:MAG: maleate cis-trans isomerase family protein [Anderseniella sp.]